MSKNIFHLMKFRRLLAVLLMLCTVASYAEEYRPAFVEGSPTGGELLVDDEKDGKITEWSGGFETSCYIIVDAKKRIYLESLKLRATPNRNSEYWDEFSVSGSNDKKEWTELKSFYNQRFETDGKTYKVCRVGSKERYRYYKITVTRVETMFVGQRNGVTIRSGFMSMSDMLLVGEETMSQSRPKFVESYPDGGGLLVDDENDGKFTQWKGSFSGSCYIIVDAGMQIKLDKIKLRPGDSSGNWVSFTVYGSNDYKDEKAWKELKAFQDLSLSSDESKYNECFVGAEDRYQYYKIVVTKVKDGYRFFGPYQGTTSMGDMLLVADFTPPIQYEEVEVRPAYNGASYYKFDTFAASNDYPWKLVDDYGISTSWGPGTDKASAKSIIVDAGVPCFLQRLKLYAPAAETAPGEKLGIAVYGGDAWQQNWTKILEVENGEWKPTSPVAYLAEINCDTQYQYYKIEKLASNTVTKLADLKFVVKRVVGEVVRNKRITPAFVSGKGQEAVDGKTATYWAANPNDEIVVDAKSQMQLAGFELYNTSTSEDHPELQWKDYELYGSNDKNSWERIKTYENCFLDTKNSGLAIFNVGAASKNFRYYKLKFIGSTGGGAGHVSEIKLVYIDSDEDPVEPTPGMQITRRLLDETVHNLNGNEIIVVDKDITITGTDKFAPLKAEENAVTIIEFENNATLTLKSEGASRYPGLWLPQSGLVVLRGHGKLVAEGGSGISAQPGRDGTNGRVFDNKLRSGQGGSGGSGGDGAAPGIGGVAGWGGSQGSGAAESSIDYKGSGAISGVASGNDGYNGGAGTASGDLVVMGNITVTSTTGMPSVEQLPGGNVGGKYEEKSAKAAPDDCRLATGGGGGGAGGHGNAPTYAVCAGGGGGGGGGAGGNSGFCSHYYAATDQRNAIDNNFNSKSASRGGAGGAGYNNISGSNGFTQKHKANYSDDADWFTNGWNEVHYEIINTDPRQKGGAMGANGADGKVYRLGTSPSIGVTSTGVQAVGVIAQNPSLADLTRLFSGKKGSQILDRITHTLKLQPSRNSVFLDDKGAEMGEGITFYPGMNIPQRLSVSKPKDAGFEGFYYSSDGKTIQAFDKDGYITVEFRNMLMSSSREGTYYINSYLNKDISLYPIFSDELSVTVNYIVLNTELGDTIVNESITHSKRITNDQTVDFTVAPFVTITTPGEIADTLCYKGMRISAVAFQTDFQPQTVTLSKAKKHESFAIKYTTRGMQYVLDDSELATYGARYYGDYTKSNFDVKMSATIKLPKVAFEKAGTDGSFYRLAGWRASDAVEPLGEEATTYSMPAKAVTMKPVFEKSAMLAIAVKQKAADDQRHWADSCSVLLHPDNTLYNNSTIAMAGDESFEKIYVNVFNPTGARLTSLKAEMGAIEGSKETRTIKLENVANAEKEDQCYFLKPSDWTRSEGEYYPVVYVTAMFAEDTKTANVKYSGALDTPAALSTDGKNFYYDDSSFDVLTEGEGRAKAGSLADFHYGYEDQVRLYVNSTNDVSITTTPDNLPLPVEDTSAWELQYTTSEPMTCLVYSAKTYDDVTITIQGSNPTAVKQVEAETSSNKVIYDVNGRRIGRIHRGAIVIENGKKRVVR